MRPGGSDSATFDNVLELLVLAGRSLPHAVMMMIPEAYARPRRPARRPQGLLRLPLVPDGAVGRPGGGRASPTAASIGATLDRNGLRPGRWLETKDGWVMLGSETGVLDDRAAERRAQGPPAAGQALPRRPRARAGSSRTRRSSARSPRQQPYARVVRRATSCSFDDLPAARAARAARRAAAPAPARLRLHRRRTCACSSRRWRATGEEPIGSMGNDTRARRPLRPAPAAVLLLQAALRAGHEPADRPDPRVDRDERWAPASAPSATCSTRRPSTRTSSSSSQPILRNGELETLRQVDHDVFQAHTIDITWPVAEGPDGHASAALEPSLRRGRTTRSPRGVNILILSDRAHRPRPRADPVAARGRRRPPPPRARGHAPAGRPRRSSPASRARSTTSRR